MSILILNMTQGSFIRVDGIKTPEYNKKVGDLLTPFEKNELSHWSKEDKMVINFALIMSYLRKTFGSIINFYDLKFALKKINIGYIR